MRKPSTAQLPMIPVEVFDQHKPIPCLVPGLQVLPADFGLVGEKRQFFLAVHPQGYRLRLSQQAYDLVALLQEPSACISYEQAARRLSETWQTTLDAYTLYRKIMIVLAPVGLLADNPTPVSLPPNKLAFRIPLLPSSSVTVLARFLIWLFHPLIAVVVCFLAGVIIILFLLRATPDIATINTPPEMLILTYLLCIASILWHELGHATACRRFHAPVGPIGFCLYVIFPAFYTDVSAIWQLSRKQRVVVDLGGIYFQSMVLILLYALYLVTNAQVYLLAVATIIGTILFSLNPFLRFDGYWMITDLLGLTALDRFQQAIQSACINGLRIGKGRVKQTLQALQKNIQTCIPDTTPLWLKILLVLYVLVTNIFWISFFIQLLRWLFSLFQTYPGEMVILLAQFQHQNWMQAGYMLGKLLVPCFVLFGLVSLVIRFTKKNPRPLLLQNQSNATALKEK